MLPTLTLPFPTLHLLHPLPSLIPRPFPPPVFHHFQYEIRRGKTWEIWSRAMPSSRHMVDTRRAVPNESCVVLSVQWLDIRVFARQTIDTVRCSQRWERETGILTVGHAPPPVCLPSVYLTSSHVTRSPSPSPAVFHTGSYECCRWERPGNEATHSRYHPSLQPLLRTLPPHPLPYTLPPPIHPLLTPTHMLTNKLLNAFRLDS